MPLSLPPELEANPEPLVRAVGRESVDVYRFLSQRFRQVDPAEDLVFQFLFRSFYRLDNAGLRPEFKTLFFNLLSAAKVSGQADLESVVRQLQQVPNLKDQQTLQFSFATKLIATVDNRMPIYDAAVASAFGFRVPYNYKSFDQRLRDYLDFYSRLQALYGDIVAANRLATARFLFRDQYQCSAEEVSDYKVLDFIFWAAGKQSRE